jgi:hypothetical protein
VAIAGPYFTFSHVAAENLRRSNKRVARRSGIPASLDAAMRFAFTDEGAKTL